MASADGPFWNSLQGFHCHREYCIKTGPDTSPASLSAPYKPARGLGEGDGTSPWAWNNVLYSAVVRYADLSSVTSYVVGSGPDRRRTTDKIWPVIWCYIMSFLSLVMRLGAVAFNVLCPSHYNDRLLKGKVNRPLNWKSGPVLQYLSWFVTEARRVKSRRVLGARRRGKLCKLVRVAYMLNSKTCPLSGGGAGSRRTLRINKQNEQINTLERTAHALSLQVQALCELAQGNDSTKGNANLGEKNPKKKA